MPLEIRQRILRYFVPTNDRIPLLTFAISPVLSLTLEPSGFRNVPFKDASRGSLYHLTIDTDLPDTRMIMNISNTSVSMRQEFESVFWEKTELRLALHTATIETALRVLKKRPEILAGIKRIILTWKEPKGGRRPWPEPLRLACKRLSDFLTQSDFQVDELVVYIDTQDRYLRHIVADMTSYGISLLTSKMIVTKYFDVRLDLELTRGFAHSVQGSWDDRRA